MNGYKLLILFVEGGDDTRFAESVLLPLLEPRFDHVQIYQYAEEKPVEVRDFINTISRLPNWSYIFIADFDQGPCVTQRKSRLTNRYGNLNTERILIVKREIESWYLAGLDASSCSELGISIFGDTNDVTKEQFDHIKPPRLPRAAFIEEVLNRFSTETARGRNESFDYAMGKHFSPSR